MKEICYNSNHFGQSIVVPYDGVPVNETVGLAVPVTVVYTLLTAVGLVFTVVCLVFNIVYRKRK